MSGEMEHKDGNSSRQPNARVRIARGERAVRRRSTLVRYFAVAALLTTYGCSGTPSTSEPTAPKEAPQSTTETSPPPSASPQQTARPTPSAKPVARKPATPKEEPARTPEQQQIVVEDGTVIEVTIDQSLSSKTNKPGDHFDASVVSPVVVGDVVAVPAGAKASGTITAAESAGRVKGSAALGMRLDSVTVRGVTYKIQTSTFEETGGGRGKRTAIGAGAGAAAGAVIGAIAGGGKGAAIGAGTGAGAGTAGAILTGERDITVPAETRVGFKLSEPVTIRK
jgi:hypothetical protein